MAGSCRSPATGSVAYQVAQSAAGAVADVGVRRGVAGGVADRGADRIAVLHLLRAAVRTGLPGACGVAEVAQLRLAYTPVVAVPVDSGPACRFGAGDRSGRAGQVVGGDAAAVRLATGALAGSDTRAGDAADGGGRDPIRNHHRRAQHSVRLYFWVRLLHGALFRGVGVYRRIRQPRVFEAAHDDSQSAIAVDARCVTHLAR